MFMVNLTSIVPAFFVRVPDSQQQVEGESSQQDTGTGAAPKVVGWVILLLACIAVYLNQSPYPLPPWIGGGNEMLMSIVMAICLIPALVVKIQISNRWAAGVREPAHNDLSSRVWIVVLPLIFLLCVTQMAYLIGPDAGGSFANVFIAWLLTGVAALIILLVVKLGSRASTALPNQELSQNAYEQG